MLFTVRIKFYEFHDNWMSFLIRSVLLFGISLRIQNECVYNAVYVDFICFFFIFSMSPTGRQADNGNSLPDCRLFYQNYTFFTKIRNSDYIFQKLSQAQLNPCRSQSFIYVSYVRPSSDSSQILLFAVKEMRTFKF